MSLSTNERVSELSKFGNKFMRRSDLTPNKRLSIATTAFVAIFTRQRGVITYLARQYMVSRMFIYMLVTVLTETDSVLFGVKSQHSISVERKQAFRYMLSLRLEGRCSIGSISALMERFGISPDATGAISQYLNQIGSLLPNTLSTKGEAIRLAVFLSDEIFSKNTPILITVDAVSSAILRIELSNSRKAEEWGKHWRCLEDNGYFAAYIVCDEGTGLCAAKKEILPEVIRQSDTYHAIAHILGIWVIRLEKAAYAAIEKEHQCFQRLDSARSEKVINKRIAQFEKAEKEAVYAIDLYENFQYLYSCLFEQLRIFDKDGKLRQRSHAEENIKAGLDLIETLGNSAITAACSKVRRTLPDLFNYLDVAKEVIYELKEQGLDDEVFKALCLAWQWNKGAIKAKKANRRKHCTLNEQHCLEFTIGHLQEDYENVKEQVYKELDRIVQSSALVECVNSIVRPYLDCSKNHITQETLNLIMFYHNHRRYKAGKREGKTPMEILTQKEQKKDWIELLFETVEQQNPSFFSSSYNS